MNSPKFKNILVNQYQPGKSNISKKRKVIKLSANESAIGASPKAIKMYHTNKNIISKYPDNKFIKLRKIISKKNKIKFNQIICGNGSDETIQLICQLFLKKGDEVIIPQYAFAMYSIYSKLNNAKVIFAKEKNFKISVDEILKKITRKTKIIFIANPNNPTGTYLDKKEILYLRKKIRSGILLVIDDAYSEYMIDNTNYSSGLKLFKKNKSTVVIRTFSKIYGLAGLRIGWAYGPRKIIDAMYKIKPPFNVNSAAIVAATEAIKDKKWLQKSIDHNKLWSNIIYKKLKDLNIELNKPSANFFLLRFNNLKKNANFINKKLKEKGLILRQMKSYKIKNALRFTIGKASENKKFIKIINQLL